MRRGARICEGVSRALLGIGKAITHHTAQVNPLRARRAAGVFKAKCALPFGATIEHLPPLPRCLKPRRHPECFSHCDLHTECVQGVRGAYTVHVPCVGHALQCIYRARAVHAYAVHQCMHAYLARFLPEVAPPTAPTSSSSPAPLAMPAPSRAVPPGVQPVAVVCRVARRP